MARASLSQQFITFTLGWFALSALAAPGCLGRSGLNDDADFGDPDAAAGSSSGGRGGTSSGRGGTSAGRGGNAGVGGMASGGSSGFGGDAGFAGVGGIGGSSAGSSGVGASGGFGGNAASGGKGGVGGNAASGGKGGVGGNAGVGASGGLGGKGGSAGSAGLGGKGGFGGVGATGGRGGSAGVGGTGGTGGTCSARTCRGCCDAQGRCQTGTANTACGTAGASCTNCARSNQSCIEPGGYCAHVPSCNRSTCPNGCCDAQGVCRDGRRDATCGSAGQSCSDCTVNGRSCAAQGFCYSGRHCGPDNCAGCCTANGECRPGASSLSCGQYGGLCENCLSNFELCQDRACSDGDRCPAAYSGCNPSAATPAPARSTACNPVELANLAQACRGNNPGPVCIETFNRLARTNPGCFDCMRQFSGSDAYARCLSPHLNESCNHQLTCALDCVEDSCGQCSSGRRGRCESSVFNANGQCGSYLYGYYCSEAALQGPAAFCDFDRYNDLGLWWQAVGGAYCSR